MSELRTEILVTNYARRKSDWSAFGQGFDTPRLHQKIHDINIVDFFAYNIDIEDSRYVFIVLNLIMKII